MTQLVVFRAAKNGSAVVFEGSRNSGGTLYTKALSISVATTISLALQKFTAPAHFLTLSVNVASNVTCNKMITWAARMVSIASVEDLYTATTLNAALTTVAITTTSSLAKRVGKVLSNAISTASQIASSIQSGASHSTFFITLTTNVASQVSVTKAIQSIKSVAVLTQVSMTKMLARTLSIAVSSLSSLATRVPNTKLTLTVNVATNNSLSSRIVQTYTKVLTVSVASSVRMFNVVIKHGASGAARRHVQGLIDAFGRLMGK